MRTLLALLGGALYAAALLVVIATLAEAVVEAPSPGSTPGAVAEAPVGSSGALAREPVAWCLAVVLSVPLARAGRWTGRAARRSILVARRGWAAVHPRRGDLGRWYHLTFHETLVEAGQAREALARLCGYRLQGGDFRIGSARPSIRRGRLGVWVTVVGASRSTRHWHCGYVRWVDDPNEYWLLRSALQPGATHDPAPTPSRMPDALDRLGGAELDDLLRAPSKA